MSREGASTAVFISYAREDVRIAEQLAQLLERRGWRVWWDRDLVAGHEFDREIEEQLQSAASVVVLWSAASVGSRWVRSEASAAADRGVLVPVIVGDVTMPLQFRMIQAVRLSDWSDQPDHPAIAQLEAALETAGAVRGEPTPAGLTSPVARSAAEPSSSNSRRKWWLAIGAAAVVLAGLVLLGLVVMGGDDGQQTESTSPVTASEVTASETTASDTAASETADSEASASTSAVTAPCPRDGQQVAEVTFVNNGLVPIDVYWVDDACAEELYGTVEPGAMQLMETFLGDTWHVKSSTDGSMLTEYHADVRQAVVNVPPGEHCSAPDGEGAAITFTNYSEETIHLYMVRPDCIEEYWEFVDPGGGWLEEDTTIGAVWSVRRPDGAPIQVHVVVDRIGEVEIY